MQPRYLLLLALAACGSTPNPANPDAPVTPDPDSTTTGDSPTATGDPAGDGDATVTKTTSTIAGATAGRTLPVTVFTPAGGTARPLVVISPGFQLARTQYESYANHLASWGFVVILTDYADTSFFPNHQKLADDVTAVIDHAVANTALAIDPAKIGVAGHSLGGKISVFAASQDARIRAVVGWDPVDSNNPSVAPQKMTGMTAAIAIVGETTNASGGGMPCAPAADNFTQFYAAAPSPAIALTVTGADHMDWVDDPSCGFCGLCMAGSIDPAVVRTVTRRLDVAWLRFHLLGDAAMEAWITPPETAVTVQQR